ncbi:MAG: uroporphyrinogen-III C-methyltransferase [Aquabacterium sp.]
MTEPSQPTPLPAPVSTEPVAQAVLPDTSAYADAPPEWMRWAVGVLSAVAAVAIWMAWDTTQRVKHLERELVRRQVDSQSQSAEARVLARQAGDISREAAARATLLETRLAEVTLQRTQVEDLIKTLNVSRDENLVADLEAGLRVASQQASLTGSAEPLVSALQTADERLTRAKQPRLDNVRRAVAKDLDRLRATRVADLTALTIRLDEAARLIDEVPLLNQPEAVMPPPPKAPPATRSGNKAGTKAGAAASSGLQADAASSAASAASSVSDVPPWGRHVLDWTKGAAQTVWNETRGLVRLTRITNPEGMLISPDQGFFLRENLKLRLLNARLALLSRQIPAAQTDLQTVQAALPRYFDLQSRKTQLLQSMLTDVSLQSQLTAVPRPDDSLAALAAMSGGR